MTSSTCLFYISLLIIIVLFWYLTNLFLTSCFDYFLIDWFVVMFCKWVNVLIRPRLVKLLFIDACVHFLFIIYYNFQILRSLFFMNNQVSLLQNGNLLEFESIIIFHTLLSSNENRCARMTMNRKLNNWGLVMVHTRNRERGKWKEWVRLEWSLPVFSRDRNQFFLCGNCYIIFLTYTKDKCKVVNSFFHITVTFGKTCSERLEVIILCPVFGVHRLNRPPFLPYH